MTRQQLSPGPQSPGQRRDAPPGGNGMIGSFYDFFSGLYPGSFVANGPLPSAANNSFFNPAAPSPGAKEVENMPPMRRNQPQGDRAAFHKQALSPTSSPGRRSPQQHAVSRGQQEPLRGQSASRSLEPQPMRQQSEWYGQPPPAQAEPADRWQPHPDYARGSEPARNFDAGWREPTPPPAYGLEQGGGQEFAGAGDYARTGQDCREYGRSEYGPGPGPDYGRGHEMRDPRDYGGGQQEYPLGPQHPVAHEAIVGPGSPQGGTGLDYSCPSFPVPAYGGPPSYAPPSYVPPQDAPAQREQPGPAREEPRQQPRERADSRDFGRGLEPRQGGGAGRRCPASPSYERPSPMSPSLDRRSPTSPSHDRQQPEASQGTEAYHVAREDLLDQHVAYYLRRHPEARKRHAVARKRPGVYQLDGREVAIEWQYATEPGQQGCLVVVDGPLRQPFSDYMEDTEANAEYEGQDIGTSALHGIPKDRRISFNDQHKVYSRLEAMKVAKEQALVREKAAGFVKEGREVPQEIMTKYKKTIQQKLGLPRRPTSPRTKRAAEVARDAPEHILEPQHMAPQQQPQAMPQQSSPQALPPQAMPPHAAPPQAVPPQCLSPQSRSPHGAPQHGFGMPPQGQPMPPQGQQQQQQQQQQQGMQGQAMQQQGMPQGMAQGHGGSAAEPPLPATASRGVQRFASHTPPAPPPAGLPPGSMPGGPSAGGGHPLQTPSASYTPPPAAQPNAAQGPSVATSSPSYTPPPVPPQAGPGPPGIPPLPGASTAPGAGQGPLGAAAMQGHGAASGTLSAASLTGAPLGAAPLGSGPLGSGPLGTQPLNHAPSGGAVGSGAPRQTGHSIMGCTSMGASANVAGGGLAPARGSLGPMACPSMGGHAGGYPALGTPVPGWRNTTPMKGRQLSTSMPPPPPPAAHAPWPLAAYGGRRLEPQEQRGCFRA